MTSFMRNALTVMAGLALAGCSANMGVDRNRDNASYRTSSDTDRSVTVRTETNDYSTSDRYAAGPQRSGQYNRWNTNTYDGPIMTDPIGRPEDRYQKIDEGAMTAGSRMESSSRTTRTETTEMGSGSASLSQQDRDFVNQAASAGMFE